MGPIHAQIKAEGWLEDDEFNNLDYRTKNTIINNFFSDNVTDAGFFQLPADEQERIKSNFVSAHIGEDPEPQPTGPKESEYPPLRQIAKEGGNIGLMRDPPTIQTPEGEQPELTPTRLAESAKYNVRAGVGDLLKGIGHSMGQVTPEKFVDTAPNYGIGYMSDTEVAELGRRLRENPEKSTRDVALEIAKENQAVSQEVGKKIVEASEFEFFKLPKEYEKSSGLLESAVGGMSRFGISMGLTAVNPAAGLPAMYYQIFGPTYEEFVKSGADSERAFLAASVTAMSEAGLEMAGTLFQFGAIKRLAKVNKVKNGSRMARFIMRMLDTGETLAATGAGEGLEEYLQQHSGEIAEIYLKNPDLSSDALADAIMKRLASPEFQKEARHAAKVGTVGGLLLGGLGAGGATVYNIGEYQQEGLDQAHDILDQKADKKRKEELKAADEAKRILGKVVPETGLEERPAPPELEGGLRLPPERGGPPSQVPPEMEEIYYDQETEERLLRDQREEEAEREAVEDRGAIPDEISGGEEAGAVGEAQKEEVRPFREEREEAGLRPREEKRTPFQAQDLTQLNRSLEKIGVLSSGYREAGMDAEAEKADAAIETIKGLINEKIEKEAAQVEPEPTEAQKEAGNYKKGHVKVLGFDITIENPKGSTREGTDPTGKKWSQEMKSHYGYFKRSKGKDGDQVDVFIGDDMGPGPVFVIDQVDPETGAFDEHKVMIGYFDSEAAEAGYLSNYEEGWQGMGAITGMLPQDFKRWLNKGKRNKPLSDEVKVKSEIVPRGELIGGPRKAPTRTTGLIPREELEKPAPEAEKEIARKVEGVVKEPWKTETDLRPREYQEKYPEKTVHEDWDMANSPRYDFEGAGDILREFQKQYSDFHYIDEKLKRIDRFIKGEISGRLHVDDSLKAARKHEPEKLNRLISQYENQPTKTDSEKNARDLILNLLNGNFEKAEKLSNTIRETISAKPEAVKVEPKEKPSERSEKVGKEQRQAISLLKEDMAEAIQPDPETGKSERITKEMVDTEIDNIIKGHRASWLNDDTRDTILKAFKEPTKPLTKPEKIPILEAEKPAAEWSTDELLAEWDKQAAEKEPTPKAKLAETKDHLANALNAFKQINDIVGEEGKLTGEFDEARWEQIKPVLQYAWDEIVAAGKSAKEFVSLAIDNLGPKSRPYFEKFVKEELHGKEPESGRTEIDEAGGTSDRTPEPGSDVEGPPSVAAGQPPGVGEEPIPAEPERTAKDTSEDVTKGVAAGGRTPKEEQAAKGPGKRSGVRKPDKPGAVAVSPEADTGVSEAEDTGLVGQPEYTGQPGSELKEEDRNHVIEPDDVIFPAGPETKIKANITAVRLVRKLQSEDRNPSPEEKKLLAKYVGWGQFSQKVFDRGYDNYLAGHYEDTKPEKYFYGDSLDKYNNWAKKYGKHLHPKLGGELTEAEWSSAAESTLNAHYTSPNIINKMWELVERMGFKSGTILEPAAGVGHFFGLMPESIAKDSTLQGVEMDSISGQILEKLYPQAFIEIAGYEKARAIPDNSVDLVISNFPFGNYSVFDKKRPQYQKWGIHNYFFGRSVDAVRPGGMVVAVTSRYTMDAVTGGKIREALTDKADFIGGIRLPDTTFKKDAGTDVVTDILVFRKKDDVLTGAGKDIRITKDITFPAKKGEEAQSYPVNEYFIDNPDMVLGKHSMKGTMYASDTYTVEPSPGNLEDKLSEAIKLFPEDIAGEGVKPSIDEEPVQYAEFDQREGVLIEKDDKIYTVEDGRLKKPKLKNSKGKVVDAINNKMKENRVRGYLKIRDFTKNMIDRMQEIDTADAEVAEMRNELNEIYDKFVDKYGTLNSNPNKFIRRIDNEFPIVDALENVNVDFREVKIKSGPRQGQLTKKRVDSYSKASIFRKRTIFPFIEPDVAENIDDALKLSRVYRARLDVNYISDLIGGEPELVKKELVDEGKAFVDPETGRLEPPDIYLSGNVKKKLRFAQAHVSDNPEYKPNIKALEAVIPEDIDLQFISFRLGSTWVPTDLVRDFLKDTMDIDADISISKTSDTTAWSVEVTGGAYEAKNTETWGTSRVPGHKLVKDALNLKRTIVTDYWYDDGVRRQKKNQEESTIAQQKQNEIDTAFVDYAKSHEKWKDELQTKYNEEKNGHVIREFPVPDIDSFPGASKDITLRPIQKKAVARALQESSLLAYGVGTGKTFSFITLAMEMRRLKSARKPLIVVHNSTIGQYSGSFKQLYPQAKILIPDDIQRTAKNRKKLLSQIATGDWDAVVLPHSFFDGIADDPQREAAFVQETIEEMEAAIEEMEAAEGNSFNVKDMKKLVKKKRVKLEKLLARRVDNALTFEKLGIDALLIDEAHAYKRSEFFTKMGTVKGIDQGASQRSTSLLLKSEYVRRKTGGKNVILATGTPISNTTAELWTILRYIRPEILEEYGVSIFDDFAANFGRTSVNTEETDTGEFKSIERFNKYMNGPELLTMFHSVSDVVLTDEAGLELPDIEGGSPQSVVVERTDELSDYISILRARRRAWESLPGREKRKQRHVPLVIFGLAKKAAIDLRLIDPEFYEDNPNNKLNKVVGNVHKIWKDTEAEKSTQAVFLDLYRDSSGTFDAYKEIKNKLIAKGIPEKEILIRNDYTNEIQYEAAFQRIREGKSRIIIGSTEKLGIGVNIQDKLIAAHHVDPSRHARPMDLEQRNGRIRREKNENPAVKILNYGVKNTLDSVLYDRMAKKQKFVDQMLTGQIDGRDFEDPLGEEQISFVEMQAAFSGNPLLLEKNDVEIQVKQLNILNEGYKRKISKANRDIKTYKKTEIPALENELKRAEEKKDFVEKQFPEGKVESVLFNNERLSSKDFVKKLSEEYSKAVDSLKERFDGMTIGEIAAISKKDESVFIRDLKSKFGDVDINVEIQLTHVSTMIELSKTPSKKFQFDEDKNISMTFTGHKGKEAFWHTWSNTVNGIVTKFNNKIGQVLNEPAGVQSRINRTHKNIKDLEQLSKEDFAQAQELENAKKRLSDIENELERVTAVEDAEDSGVSEEVTERFDRELGQENEQAAEADTKFSEPEYFIHTGEGFIPQEGAKEVEILLEGEKPVTFFAHKTGKKGRNWIITEASTGREIAFGPTKEKARQEANRKIYEFGIENFLSTVEESRKKEESPWVAAKNRIIDTLKDEGGYLEIDSAAVKATYDDLVELGRHVYESGARKLIPWRKQMRKHLLSVWDKIKHLSKEMFASAKAAVSNQRGEVVLREEAGQDRPGVFQRFRRAKEPLPSEYEQGKDSWMSNKDWAIQENSIEASNIKDRIDTALGKKRHDREAREIDQAIHIYLDIKRNPQHMVEFFDQQTDDQKHIVRLTEKVTSNPGLTAIADYIANEYEKIGLEALSQNIIFNVIDNYVARAWKILKNQFGTDNLQKFKTTSRHAKQRVFETILEGQAAGYELQIKGASDNLNMLKDEIARVVEDKRLLREMQKMKDENEEPLVSAKHEHGFKEIDHPNFKDWKVVGNIKRGEIQRYRAQNFRVQSKYAVMKEGKKRAVRLLDSMAEARLWVRGMVAAGERPTELRIEERHTLWERQRLYAKESVAKDLNNILGVSRLKGLKPIDTLTKYNAVLKAWILITSFFHHQAFIRSYWFGTRKKEWSEWNIAKAKRLGLQAIKERSPEIKLLVRNGLTLGRMQDWEESILREEQTIFGAMLDKAGPLKWVKDEINELRNMQANYLFRNLGMGLKAKAALIEYRNALSEHPEMEPNDRAKMVASLINDDFGGLHLQRMGRNPTYQHIFRLMALAPDWTESNIRTMYKTIATGGKPQRDLYRRFWASVLTKAVGTTIIANLLFSFFDDDNFFERYRTAWKAGGLRWLGVDITPLYRAIYGEKASAARKYFSILGHFRDVFKFIFKPIRSAHHKGSVIYRTFYELISGEDWRGFGFTTTSELIGTDDKGRYTSLTKNGKLVFGQPKGGKMKGMVTAPQAKTGPVSYDRILSYTLAQMRNNNPVQTQQLLGWIQGEIEGFDAIARGAGIYIQSTYPTEKKLNEQFIDEVISHKSRGKPITDVYEKLKAHNVREGKRDDGLTLSWPKIVQAANKRLAAEKFYNKRSAINE